MHDEYSNIKDENEYLIQFRTERYRKTTIEMTQKQS